MLHTGADVEVEIYSDNDQSAKDGGTRPDFNRLVADVAAGKIDVIVAWDGNRLMRNQVDRAALVKACRATGTTITTTQSGDIDLSGSDGAGDARVHHALG